MRLPFFFSTVTFCFFFAMSLIVFFRRLFPGRLFSRRAVGRRRDLETVFVLFCALLAFWAFGTAFFVSAETSGEALLFFRLFAFSWFFAPAAFLVFSLMISGIPVGPLPAAAASMPGAAVFAAHIFDSASVVQSVSRVSGGWHVDYSQSVWSALLFANTLALPFIALIILTRAALFSPNERRRAQTAVVLASFVPAFALSIGTGVVARWFGVASLPPLTPSFLAVLVVGIAIALFRYELLELTPFNAVEQIIAGVTDAIVLVSPEGTVLDSNLPGAARGASLRAFIEGAQQAPSWLEEKLAEKEAEFEAKFAFSADDFVSASIRVRTVRDAAGTAFGYIVAARDLSTEKTLEREKRLRTIREEALRSAEDNFARLFRVSPAGMIVSEIAASEVLDINDVASAFFGRSRDALVGRNLWSLGLTISPELLNGMRSQLDRGEQISVREIHLRKESGEPIVLAVAAVPISFDGRKASLISFIDISELSMLRIELIKAQKMESIGAMAAGLAHDFNNILTAIMGNVSLARLSLEGSEKAVPDVSEALLSAEAACARARDLSRQLFLFARGGVSSAKTADLFALVLETTRMALSGSSVSATFSCDPDMPQTIVDRDQVAIVFNNLALNAAQSMPSGGVLRVRGFLERVDRSEHESRAPGDYACVEFADEGPGIAPEYLHRIFDPYLSSRRKNGGLGLAVCESIVKRHGGWMTVDSTPGKGSVFTVHLPAAEVEKERSARPPNVPEPVKDTKTILVMDDEFAIRMMAERLIARLGYEALTTGDGEAAVAAFKDARSKGIAFRAVILDLTVPGGMNGVDAASVIRSIDSSVPIYISSGYDDDPVLNDYAYYGFTGVIPKPYSLEDLSVRLNAVR